MRFSFLVIVFLLSHLIFPSIVGAQSLPGDANGDGKVDDADYAIWRTNYNQTKTGGASIGDFNTNGKVEGLDYLIWLTNFGKTSGPSPTPAPTLSPSQTGWFQDAHNASRTGFTPEEPLAPWNFVWKWNASDSTGGLSCTNQNPATGHCYNAPKEARPVTGGGKLFAPAGSWGLYALNLNDGKQAWRNQSTGYNAAPAYDPTFNSVFAGGSDGKLYKFDAANGTNQGAYTAGSAINKAVMIVYPFIYAVADDGRLHKVDGRTMTGTWVYAAGSAGATPPAFSASRKLIIYGTADLNIHAVSDSSGAATWKVKPTPNSPGFPNEYTFGWPVVADQAGIVFIRMRLDHNAHYGPGPSSQFPNTNQETRDYLVNNDHRQNLFALDLTNGTKKFIPAVGYGSTEDFYDNKPYGVTGSMPVVKKYTDKEVAYIHFRNGSSGTDYRWDGHMGEMVLDNQTITGLAAGDLRFVQMSRYNGYGGNAYVFISDEQTPITLAGNTIFHAHWGASEAVMITDRSANLGLQYSTPIKVSRHPIIIRRQAACSNYNFTTHWTTCGLTLYNDGRYWGGPGWFVYWNVEDPPKSPSATAYSAGFLPRYTFVTNGYVIVSGNGGDLFVLKHSGI
jgi:hypothetical protein